MKKPILLAAMLAIALTAAAPALAHSEPASDIQGFITNISDAVVLVEEAPADESGSAKGAFTVTDETAILWQEGNELVPVTFEDLRVGQPVAATYMGPVAESYPAQGIAGSIGILESSDDGSGDEDDLLCLIPEGCGPDGYILQVPAENSPGSSTPRFLTEGL